MWQNKEFSLIRLIELQHVQKCLQADAEQAPASEQLDSLQRLINRDVRGNDRKVSLSCQASLLCWAAISGAAFAPSKELSTSLDISQAELKWSENDMSYPAAVRNISLQNSAKIVL